MDQLTKIKELVTPILQEEDILLYDVKWHTEGKNRIASEYFLEVCSPGAERELRSDEEIQHAVGEYVYVKLKNPKNGLDEVKGDLTAYENGIVYINYMAKAVKKKAEIEKENISLIRLSVRI